MRILMIGPIEKTGGVSTHTRMLAKALKDKGIEVHLYNTSTKKESKIKLINDLVKLFKKSFGVSFKILKYYRKVDLVHIQASGPIGGFLPAIFGCFLKSICKYNLVVTFHYGRTEEFVKRRKNFMGFVIARVDLFILVSERQKKLILEYLGKNYGNKIAVISNGFDSKSFYPIINKTNVKQKLNLPLDKKVILNVASLYPVKGQRYLIEAVREIIKYRKDFLCIIVGDGPLREGLKAQIKKLGLENYVKLVGSKPHDEIPLWMNAADLFVLPSLSEGNPTVMFEALGCGKPFVGTKVDGIPEVITSEDYGLLCEPANAEDLAEKILIALEKSWGIENIRKYAEQFAWENVAKEVIKMYERILRNVES